MIATRPTLVFTSGFDPFQLLINIGTFSRAGHVAIGYGNDLLHAYEPGVEITPRSYWFGEKKQRLIHEYEIVPDVSRGMLRCIDRIGEPYDVVGVLRAMFVLTLKRFASPVRTRGTASKASHTCASFVMLLDPEGGIIPEWRDVDRSVVTPADLLIAARGPSFQPVSQNIGWVW